jgi:hypothetical protein
MHDILKAYWLWEKQSSDLEKHICRAMERNPSQPFFHVIWARTLFNDDPEECLRVAKKGLKLCNQTTPAYAEDTLRYLAGMSARSLGIKFMTNAPRDFKYAGEEQRNGSTGRAVAFFTSALKDFEMIATNSSPDCRYFKHTLVEYIPLLFLLKGSEALEEIKVCVK